MENRKPTFTSSKKESNYCYCYLIVSSWLIMTIIMKPWLALQWKACMRASVCACVRARLCVCVCVCVYLSVCLETSGQCSHQHTDWKNDRLTDRQTDRLWTMYSCLLLVLIMYIAHMYVCLQAASAPYGQHWCLCVCVCVDACVRERKPYWRCVPFARVQLDSNYLCFSLRVWHSGSFQELYRALFGSRQQALW